MATAVKEMPQPLESLRQTLIPALRNCVTEADINQVLYASLHPVFGYQVVSLQVLERDGWFHAIAVDHGVLQDRRRRRISEAATRHLIEAGRTAVYHPELTQSFEQSRGGLAVGKIPRTIIWVPVEHQGQVVASVLYQSAEERVVPPEEIAFLEEIHRNLGVLISNAYLNETTRDQGMRLSALNTVARALSSTLDEAGIAAALQETLSQLLPVDAFSLAVWTDANHAAIRLLRSNRGRQIKPAVLPIDHPSLNLAREVLLTGDPRLGEGGGFYRSVTWVAVKEGGQITGALSIQANPRDAYEESTVRFLEQVADQVALALRNAWSYAASEAQRRRLEVVNAVGRRLSSSLDSWSIMRTLREELTRHLSFDLFALATIRERAEGPTAEGYVYDSGHEQITPAVPLSVAGPSREAYETGRPVLVRRSPWAQSIEARHPSPASFVIGEGAVITTTKKGRRGRIASRSMVWVPVLHGDRVTALLSLQSYRADAFTEEDVKLLEDVAAHVSLALANADHYASAQTERRRLEALHVIELGVAGSADERQIAESVFKGTREYVPASHLVLAYLDPEGRLVGYGSEQGSSVRQLEPVAVDRTGYFRRVMETGRTLMEQVDPKEPPGATWVSDDRRLPRHVLWVPVIQGERVIAAISAQRLDDSPFTDTEIQLLESTGPLVGIALRTVRLHRANELALAHSVRIQEVAALAGHDLASVVSSVAEQARSMLDARGVACWAFDAEGRISAAASNGERDADKVIKWATRNGKQPLSNPLQGIVSGVRSGLSWDFIPLWYADKLVGAVGSIHGVERVEEPSVAAVDFARHAAIAIENARLVAETRGRIHTLEAVAAFTELDPTQPARTRAEMGRLIERALQGAGGAVWLLDGRDLVRLSDGVRGTRTSLADASWLLKALRGQGNSRRLQALLDTLSGEADAFATPILVDGRLAGLLTASARAASPGETRRLLSVLAGQAGVVLGRLALVDALDRERRMMNAILRHSLVGIILQDAGGRIIYANPAAERIYGVRADAMAGQTSADVLAQAGAVPAAADDTGDSEALEFQMKNPDRIVQVRTVPIPGLEDEPAGLLSLHEDITQQRQVMEAKDLMLRAIGHEVRSPAAAMKTMLASLVQWSEQVDSRERQMLIEEAYEMSDRLLSLVEGQLIIAKLETRRFEPNPAPIRIDQALQQVMGVLRHRYGERTSAVEVKLDSSLPAAYCEPTHLNQVLTNLIGNALEYTQAPIRVRARLTRGWLEVTVHDDGPGVPADRIESLFQKTGPAGRNRARGGLGLGLYLCWLVVERSFGGRIWLDHGNGHGTTFKFTVPTVEVSAKRAELASVGS